MAIIIVISAQINLTAINKGEISASKEVRNHFKFPQGCGSVEFKVIDELGEMYTLKAKRRMRGDYPKEAIAGLKTYIQAKGLVEGDRITIFKEEKEVAVFGAVLGRSVRYSIRHEKAAQGGGNFTGAEAGER
ncbi:hypothetical protein SLEP1_g19514 [Rubroshorea leprosula]|uniref:Uncharacterized protein n=1 Tax=Rubroshorea leprosula TaxID=152421 RepID=A0AAV5IZL6_9ROSI|nr:hypothetical protein SLEP1_g19514 [Rubroshorea leprosula]